MASHRFPRGPGARSRGDEAEKANSTRGFRSATSEVDSYGRAPAPSSYSPPHGAKNAQDHRSRPDGSSWRSDREIDSRFKSHTSARRRSRSPSHSPYRNDRYRSPRRNRSRSRSRSPFRHDKTDTQPATAPHVDSSTSASSGSRVRSDHRQVRISERHEERANAQRGGNGAELSRRTHSRETAATTESTGRDLASNAQTTLATPIEHTDGPIERQLSDAETQNLIDQRRRRREEIRARVLKEQAEKQAKAAQHPAVQALKDSSMISAPSTPTHDSSAAPSEQPSSPSSTLPATPLREMTPGSPASINVSNGVELSNQLRADSAMDDDDGPSAADYDPNQDYDMFGNKEYANPVSKDDKKVDDDGDDDMFAPDFEVKDGPAQVKGLDASMIEDHADGHYRIVLGELLDNRYLVKQQIGKGTFATVVRAQDVASKAMVAIKIACNNDVMLKAGQKEIDFVTLLNEKDPEDTRHVIRLERHFMHKKHLCLVFEALGQDLRETLKKYGRNKGLNLQAIRTYAQQMFLALGHLKKCNILHADLKPDNMLVSDSHTMLKICDLGTAGFADQFDEITPYLVSRFYRAPEVILGIPFDFAIDMWSVGCTLFELYTGRILFAGSSNNQMLRAIQECRGKVPNRMLKKARTVDKYFDDRGNFASLEVDTLTGNEVIRWLPLNKIGAGKDLKSRLESHLQNLTPTQRREHIAFLDLMDKCLQVDPVRRITPNDALRHEFVAYKGLKTAPNAVRDAN